MPRLCTVCHHPDRSAIDRAVVSQSPNRQIASLHGVSEAAIRRHARSQVFPEQRVIAYQSAVRR
jgi:hypothetical protein